MSTRWTILNFRTDFCFISTSSDTEIYFSLILTSLSCRDACLCWTAPFRYFTDRFVLPKLIRILPVTFSPQLANSRSPLSLHWRSTYLRWGDQELIYYYDQLKGYFWPTSDSKNNGRHHSARLATCPYCPSERSGDVHYFWNRKLVKNSLSVSRQLSDVRINEK